MKSENMCPEMDTQFDEIYDERPKEEIYSDLLCEVFEVCSDAKRFLELDYTNPEHTLLILEDCIKKIEDLCCI